MGELLGSMSGVLIGLGIGPFAQGRLDEAFGLAVGPWCVGFGADVLDGESFAGIAPGEGPVAGTVVGHDAFDGDAEAFVVRDGGLEEGCGADATQTWTNSQPLLRPVLWLARSPVMR